jgi:hypothetical protein
MHFNINNNCMYHYTLYSAVRLGFCGGGNVFVIRIVKENYFKILGSS